MNNKRVRQLNKIDKTPGPVVYWMSRDQRVDDNWALIYAKQLAVEQTQAIAVLFCLVPEFLGATLRQYDFMLKGLQEVEQKLGKLNIPFILLTGHPSEEILKLLSKNKIGSLITDFNPLRINREWKEQIKHKINIPFYEVDAHNVIPVWLASDKQEYAAYTIRPKINRLLPEYLTEFPKLKKMKTNWLKRTNEINWDKIYKSLKVERSVLPITSIQAGSKAAFKCLNNFINNKLSSYNDKRNDPALDGQSGLSPYLHFGQISAQRVALEIQKYDQNITAQENYLEELIVRRELSDNYCYYNSDYDNFNGFPDWAKKTLNEHRNDKRDYLYSLKQFEKAKTHDNLWNAAQLEMVCSGKMHGYMRMYWAKKILEWSITPDDAMKTAIYLNDKYELDGRDPNGYAGAAWSIGGVHDRAWNEREIFGKIRYMNYNGCKRKFNVVQYVKKVNDSIK